MASELKRELGPELECVDGLRETARRREELRLDQRLTDNYVVNDAVGQEIQTMSEGGKKEEVVR